MKKILAALSGLLLVALLVITGASSASAHTPTVQASCDGVTVQAVNYGSLTGEVVVKVNGETVGTGKISEGKYGPVTFQVPQNGEKFSYQVDIDTPDGSYELHESGKVGPCGELPPTPIEVNPQITITPATCESDGKLDFAQVDNTSVVISPEYSGPGTYTITYTADEGYVIKGESVFTATVEPRKTGEECNPVTTPPTSTEPSTTPPTSTVTVPTTVTEPPTTVTEPPTTVTGPSTTVTAPPSTVTEPPTTETAPPVTSTVKTTEKTTVTQPPVTLIPPSVVPPKTTPSQSPSEPSKPSQGTTPASSAPVTSTSTTEAPAPVQSESPQVRVTPVGGVQAGGGSTSRGADLTGWFVGGGILVLLVAAAIAFVARRESQQH